MSTRLLRETAKQLHALINHIQPKLKNIYSLKSYLLILMISCCASYSMAQEKKNVLFIMADDFNHWAHSIGYYEQSKTPNIDRLAEKGVLFMEAHCSSPVCNPSRNAMLSGYRPSTTGISTNGGGFVRDVKGFENIVSMNQYFKEQGYYVYGAGKIWHPGRMEYSNPDCDPGNWSDLNTNPSGCNGGTYSRFEATSEKYTEFVWSGNTSSMSESNCNDFGLANDVADLLGYYPNSAYADRPFFIACGFFRPHLPWNSPKQFWDLYGEDTLSIPKGYKENDLVDINGAGTQDIFTELVQKDKWIEGIHAYLASVSLADHNVGIVLDALEASDYKDNTIIVFMGDHGWHLGEKNRWSKYAVYDQANHTTMIIYDPTAEGNGKVCYKVVSMQDIYPTLIELTGIEPKTNIEGRSIAPLLENPNRADWDHPVLMTYSGTNYIKTNQYRFVNDGAGSQLYNVAIDPYEWNNLYGKQGTESIVKDLKIQMDSMIQIGMQLRSKLLSGYNFKPQTHVIPGIIEAEDYDEGAQSQTYHDADDVNTGGLYRADGVDIEITDDQEGGSFHITSTENGEWLQYTVSEFEKGIYNVSFRLRYKGTNSAKVHLFMNEIPVGSVLLTVAQNGWLDMSIDSIFMNPVNNLKMRVEIEGKDVDLNFIRFTRIGNLLGLFNTRDTGQPPLLNSTIARNGILKMDLSPCNPAVKIKIYNLDGTCIEESLIPGEIKLDYKLRENIIPGMYILYVNDGENEWAEKFFRE